MIFLFFHKYFHNRSHEKQKQCGTDLHRKKSSKIGTSVTLQTKRIYLKNI